MVRVVYVGVVLMTMLVAGMQGQSTDPAVQSFLDSGEWVAPDGTEYDLSELRGRTVSVSYGDGVMQFQISFGIANTVTCHSALPGGPPESDAAACQTNTGINSKPQLVAGTLSATGLEQIDRDEPGLGIKLTYGAGEPCGSGKPRETIVTFACDHGSDASDDEPNSAKEDPPGSCVYQVTWKAKYGCPAGGLSGGWIFIILLLVGGSIYIGAGIFYKHKQQGAVGIEAIPNVDFWRDLPALVTDGIGFFKEWLNKEDQPYETIP